MVSDYKTLIIYKDEDSFKNRESLLLLGKWCEIDNQAKSNNYNIEYVYNPLSDNDQREKHYYYIQNIKDELTVKISNQLNFYHNVKFSEKDWKLLIGNFVLCLSHTAYIQWLLLQSALKRNDIAEIRVPIIDNDDSYVPKDTQGLISLLSNDNFYICLIKKIIDKSNIKINKSEYFHNISSPPIYSKNRFSLKNFLSKSINYLGKYLFKLRLNRKVLFIDSYLEKKVELKLNLNLRQIPFVSPFRKINIKNKSDSILRAKMKSNDFNGFEKVLYELLWEFLPICYLEGFSSIFEDIKKKYRFIDTKLIVTSNAGMMENDTLLLYLLTKKEKRPKIICLQHGGRYGTAKYNCIEDHEIDCSDYFFSWGWKTKSNVIPSVMHKNLGKKINKNKVGSYLIYLPYNTARIPKRITTSISITGIDKQYENDKIFFQNLNPKIKKMMRIRYNQHGWQSKIIYGNLISDFNESKKTYMQDNNRARIIISTNCSTTILESLAFNVPTVSFFDRDSDRLSINASKYFNILEEVGIIHYDALSASKFVNSKWDNVESWWNGERVVKAKENFIKKFANLSNDSEKYFLSQLVNLYLKEVNI